jgi:hypothetical protein
MLDLAAATADTFAPHVGERFRLLGAASELELELCEVLRRDQLTPPPGFRQAFILFFRSPPGPRLPQGTYRLDNGELGEFAVFLVPFAIEPNGGMRYQAPFN